MPLKSVLETLDGLEENLQGLYKETADGKFVLEIEGVENHPGALALKNALERQKTDRRKLADELAKVKAKIAALPEDFDYEATNAELTKLRAQLEELEADPAKRDKLNAEAVQARKLLEQKIEGMGKAHAKEIEKLNGTLKAKEAFIEKVLKEEGLTKALVEVGVSKELFKAAKAMLLQDIVIVEEDGEYHAVVKSDAGDLEVNKYVQDWAASDEGKPFITPAKGSDAGAGGGKGAGAKKTTDRNPWTKEFWNLTEQGQILKTDRPRAVKLAKEAGKTIPVAPVEAA